LKKLADRVQAFFGSEDALGYFELNFWIFLEVSVQLGVEKL
jgi:hypothetical protein